VTELQRKLQEGQLQKKGTLEVKKHEELLSFRVEDMNIKEMRAQVRSLNEELKKRDEEIKELQSRGQTLPSEVPVQPVQPVQEDSQKIKDAVRSL